MADSKQISKLKSDFIEGSLESKALLFGEFTLKSGRQSPYFFNAGLLYNGSILSTTAQSYASAIVSSAFSTEFDILFGPAYKGIPLAAITCMALEEKHGVRKEYCYNRKEKKDHGEGGQLVGASMEGKRVVIIDDVLTSGKAVREAIALLPSSATLTGVVVLVDRQEVGPGELSSSSLSTVQELSKEYNIPVVPICTLNDLIDWASSQPGLETELEGMKAYREQWGAKQV
ncbi:orotate phosphoribosyltransferase [Phaffia rhodozyma]|uniref:orotate phosphoribosyltransferase n=1 Tax=Phaffia rhodozyma TaxID=264483 RepID=A0A0F7SLY1_PHARH|nr:orotate phosphoribosyltransferase [Phaffia rhodozyma]